MGCTPGGRYTGDSMMQSMMQRALVAVALTLALLATGSHHAAAQDRARQLGQALLQFEENVTWESVSDKWRGLRDPWIATVRDVSSPDALARQVMALEEAMGWDSVEDAWRQRRPGWVSMMQSANSLGVVARGLLELEENTLWSAVSEEWRQLRDPWVARVKSIH